MNYKIIMLLAIFLIVLALYAMTHDPKVTFHYSTGAIVDSPEEFQRMNTP